MNNENFCKYVSNRGMCYNCNVYPKKLICSTRHFIKEDYENIKNNDKVYVISDRGSADR